MDIILKDYTSIFAAFLGISALAMGAYGTFRYLVGARCQDKLFLQKCTYLVIWLGLYDLVFLFFGGLFYATYGMELYVSIILLLANVVLLFNMYLLSLCLIFLSLIPVAQYAHFGILKKESTEIWIARLNRTCHSGYKKAHLSFIPPPNGKNVLFAIVLFIAIVALFSIAALCPFWCFAKK